MKKASRCFANSRFGGHNLRFPSFQNSLNIFHSICPKLVLRLLFLAWTHYYHTSYLTPLYLYQLPNLLSLPIRKYPSPTPITLLDKITFNNQNTTHYLKKCVPISIQIFGKDGVIVVNQPSYPTSKVGGFIRGIGVTMYAMQLLF